MATTFGELIEACGVPRLLVANKTRRVFDHPFLLVRTYLSVPTRRFKEVQAQLEAMRIVASRPGTTRGPRGGAIATVEVAVAADVAGLSQDELDRAVADRRVLNVHFHRSMGDGYVTLNVNGPHLPVDEAGYHFVFEPPCRLTDADLPYEEAWNYESATDFLDGYWQRHFTRELALPPAPARPRPVHRGRT